MVRLAILGIGAISAQAIVARLRGVTLASAEECDAAVVLGPAPVADLLQAGKDVLIRLDVFAPDWLHALADSATHAGARFVVANPLRHLPSRQLLRQQLDAGKLGEPGLIRLHDWGPTPPALLADLDLILWYFGKPPSHLHSVRNEMVTQVHLGFPGGGMALLDHARTPQPHAYLSIIGSTGAAYADDHRNTQLLLGADGLHALPVDEGIRPWVALARGFVEQDAEPPAYPTWQDTLAVAHLLELT